MASRDTNDLHIILKSAYYKAAEGYKSKYSELPQPFITCTYRSGEEQNALYNSTPKVTNAKAGESPHNFKPSLAFDIAFITLTKQLDWNNELFKKFAYIIAALEPRVECGINWKSFKDAPHFQLLNWKTYLNK